MESAARPLIRVRQPCAALALLLLAACGGGGGNSGDSTPAPAPAPMPAPVPAPAPPPAPMATALPAVLTVDAPATVETGAAVALKTALPAGAADLRYEWDFGDGQQSTEPQPTHAWAAPGRYGWRVTVRNGDGAAVSAAGTVQAAAFDRLAGAECTGGAAKTGWCWQGSGLGAFARDIHCADALHCVAVGDLGQTVFTRDGGRSWTFSRPAPGFSGDLIYVRMADADTVYTLERGARTVWRSRDGGRSWTLAARNESLLFGFGAGYGPWGLQTIDADTIVGIGPGSRISRDAGATWQALPIADVQRVTPNGFLWNFDERLFSPDRGASVRTLPPAADGAARAVIALQADDPLRLGVLVYDGATGSDGATIDSQGGHVLLSSTNGGVSFTASAVTVPLPPSGRSSRLYDAVLRADGSGDALRRSGPDLSLPLDTEGVAVHWLRTADGGRSWSDTGPVVETGRVLVDQRLSGDGQAWILLTRQAGADPAQAAAWRHEVLDLRTRTRTVVAAPAQAVVNAGRSRTVSIDRQGGGVLLYPGLGLSSADAGQSWQALPGLLAREVAVSSDLLFFDRRQGLAVTVSNEIAVTDDGGLSWQKLPLDRVPIGAGLTRLSLLPDGSVLLSSPYDRPYRSTDRGRTWTAMPVPGSILGTVGWLDAQRGWGYGCVSVVDASGTTQCEMSLFRTTDGGVSWQPLGPLPGLPDQLVFRTALDGVMHDAFHQGAVWWTADGGLTWNRSVTVDAAGQRSDTEGNLPMQFSTRSALAWMPAVLGGREVMLRSTDGGRTWSTVALPLAATNDGQARLLDVFNLDDQHLWAVGRGGLALASRDGGLTWHVQPTGTTLDLGAVYALDPHTVWASSALTTFASDTGGQ